MEFTHQLESFRQWIAEVEKLNGIPENSPVLTEQERLIARMDLLMRGRKLSRDFNGAIEKEYQETMGLRHYGLEIFRHAQPTYGADYEESRRVHDQEVVTNLTQLSAAIIKPIAAVRRKLEGLAERSG